MKFLPAIVPISIIVAVGPIRYHLRLYTVPTAIVKILAGIPAICRPREGFFHNFDFDTVLPTSRYCYNLYYVPPAIVFFAAERP